VSPDIPDVTVMVTVVFTICALLLSGVSLAGIRWPHEMAHVFRPAMNSRNEPCDGLAISRFSPLMLISHDLAPAIAVPFTLMMRLRPCIIMSVIFYKVVLPCIVNVYSSSLGIKSIPTTLHFSEYPTVVIL
jgi:hypothetical protein